MTPEKPRMSDQWARALTKHKRRSLTDIAAAVAIVCAMVWVALFIGAAVGRGMADAEASIEMGPEGME